MPGTDCHQHCANNSGSCLSAVGQELPWRKLSLQVRSTSCSLADQRWCQDNVIPLLDWADPGRARRTWDGFLYWGRWNGQLLSIGLLTQYLETAGHIHEFREELRRQLCQHLASVAIYSDIHPIENGWLRAFTARVDPATRTEMLEQVAWLLKTLPIDAVSHQWPRWMRRYWSDRLASVPTQLTIDEASALALWVPYLGESMAEGATLAMDHAAGITQHSNLLHELTDERVARAPTEGGPCSASAAEHSTAVL